jgi:hypothetical protein
MKGWKQQDLDKLGNKVRFVSSSPIQPKKRHKQQWIELGEKRFYARSKWEANYARYLQWQKEQGLIEGWDHEPDEFQFPMYTRGVTNYLPDFRVIRYVKNYELVTEYHEVKGYMDSKSKTKINRFRKHFPEYELKVITSDWFKNNKPLRKIIPGWD